MKDTNKIEELKKKIQGKEKHIGCGCCPETKDVLPMETQLYSGFGGWNIVKDDEVVFIK